MAILNQFGVLNTLEDHGELSGTFKREAFTAAEKCMRDPPKSRSIIATMETLENKKENRVAMLAGYSDQHRTL